MNGWKASFLRIGRLAAIPFGKDLKSLGILLAVLAGFHLVVILLGGTDWLNKDKGGFWGAAVFIMVTIRAARAFSELDHDPAATEWILFPATPTEKYVAAQVRLGVVFYGLAIGWALAASALMGWLQTLVNGGALHWLGDSWLFAPSVTPAPLSAVSGGAVQSVLWGMMCVGASAIFGKHAVWKFLLVFFGAMLLWFGAMPLVHWMVFADQMHLPTYDRDGVFRSIGFLLSSWGTPALNALISQWWFDVLFPTFFIVYGWAKLREVEARNALQS